MRKRFDRSCAAGIFLAVTLLFTFCAGTGSAEASHHIDLMAQTIAKYYEEEYGPLGFGWTGEQLGQLSDTLYFLDGLSPLEDQRLRLIAGQRYFEGALEGKARERAIEFARNAAVTNLLLNEGQAAEPYVVGLRLFDAADAPLILKVSLRLAGGQIICVELGEDGEAISFAVLDQEENALIPFLLSRHFLRTSERPPKWRDPEAPDAFWSKMEHLLIRCSDGNALIRSYKKAYGEDETRWPITAQAIEGLWDEDDQNGLKAIPYRGISVRSTPDRSPAGISARLAGKCIRLRSWRRWKCALSSSMDCSPPAAQNGWSGSSPLMEPQGALW